MKKRYDSTPRQLIKVAYGQKNSRHACGLVLAMEDLQVMEMDAPVLLPAGSTFRETPLPYSDPDYFFAKETLVFRDPIEGDFRASRR